MTSIEVAKPELKQFIGGAWNGPKAAPRSRIADPFTGELVAHVAAGTRADAEAAIDAAAAASPAWARRAGRAAADLPGGGRRPRVPAGRGRRRWLARETGATSGSACSRCGFVPGLLRQAAALAYAPLGQVIPPTTRHARDGAPRGRSAWSARSRPGTPR